MLKVFDRLPPTASPVYEMGSALGVLLWDSGSKTWMKKALDDSVTRKGYASVMLPMSSPISEADAAAELRVMEESVLPGLGMIVAWRQDGIGFISMAAGACELADIDYGEVPTWAR